jgi:hypothetical protein
LKTADGQIGDFPFVGNRNADPFIYAFTKQFSVNHKNAYRIPDETTCIQSKKSRIYRSDGTVAGCYGRSFFRTDRGVQSVMDIEADFGQVEAEEVDLHGLFVRELACHLGVFDAIVDGLEILGGN